MLLSPCRAVGALLRDDGSYFLFVRNAAGTLDRARKLPVAIDWLGADARRYIYEDVARDWRRAR